MNDEQWTQFTELDDKHRENAALQLIRQRLPVAEPTRGWVNFEFIALDGSRFDVDALVLTPAGIFLIELAPYRGHLDIGSDIWLQTRQNEVVDSMPSPVVAARRKARKLHRLLDHFSSSAANTPPIQPLVFLSEQDVSVEIDADGHDSLVFHPDHGDDHPTIIDALQRAEAPGVRKLSAPLENIVLKRFEQALREADIAERSRRRLVGDYRLGELLDTTEYFQDYLATHKSTGEQCMARVFREPRGASEHQLARIQEAARREFDLLSELDHRGILRATKLIGHEYEPAVLFEYPEDSVRLDLFMARQRRIGPRTRYFLLEAIAEAVRYAHEHRIVHRALNPRCVLVVPGEDDEEPSVRLLSWHTGRQEQQETGTRHITEYLHERSKVYLAPELTTSPDVGPEADVFGLGALGYYLFTGQSPAPDTQSLVHTLASQAGLRPSNVNDDVSPGLDDFIYRATAASPANRQPTAERFIEQLEAIRDDVFTIEYPPQNPAEARSGDVLGAYTVLQRLGRGSTATAFLVKDVDDRKVVLKVANDEARSSRIDAEAEALEQLDSDFVVKLYDTVTVANQRALVTQYAGKTLLDLLRERSALSLDEQRRYGKDLCRVLRQLERAGLFHRDIKPANIAVGHRRANTGKKRLFLFDFSLHGAAIDNLGVGTRAYRDPFLGWNDRDSWDDYADRYSAAVVLHEMVTRRLPQWGESPTNPAADQSAQLHLEIERFPALLRDELRDFFEKALARDWRERFSTADEMLRAWRDIYGRTQDTSHGDEDIVALAAASSDTPVRKLPISAVAVDAAEGLGAQTVEEFLQLSTQKLHFLEGGGKEVRQELLGLREALVDQFPWLVADEEQPTADEDYSESSVDKIKRLLARKPTSFDYADDYEALFKAVYLSGLPWQDARQLAEATEQSPEELEKAVRQLRRKWQLKPSLKPLRDDVVRIVDSLGGAAEAAEVARTVYRERGSRKKRDEALQNALAVTRAAVETELTADDARIQLLRHNDKTFIATRNELLDIIPDLGERADVLAARKDLASSRHSYQALAEILHRTGFYEIGRERLLHLAVAASTNAAVSKRLEIYPAEMSPTRALNLCSNLLLRRAPLTPQELVDTVQSRYEAVTGFPEHPELAELVERAGIELVWRRKPEHQQLDQQGGRYVSRYGRGTGTLALTRSTASSWGRTFQSSVPADERKARNKEFYHTLEVRHRDGGFFALTVEPDISAKAAGIIAEQFELTALSVDRVFVDVIREITDDEIWDLIVKTDAPDAPAAERRKMGSFLRQQKIADAVFERICAAGDRVLLTDPGLLGHWNELADTMSIIRRLRGRTRTDTPDLTWLMVPLKSASGQRRPTIADVAVPVDPGDYVRVPADLIRREEFEREREPA